MRQVIASLVRPDAVQDSMILVDRAFDVQDIRRHPVLDVQIPTRPRAGRCRRPRTEPWTHWAIDPSIDRAPRPLRESGFEVLRDSPPLHRVGLPRDWEVARGVYHFPIRTPIEAWGRRWELRESTLGPHVGLGLFSLQDIEVPEDCPHDSLPALLPFCGPMYCSRSWNILSRQCPTYGRYGLRIRGRPAAGFRGRRMVYDQMDGYPYRTGNLVGFVNSTRRCRRVGVMPNAEWVEFYDHAAFPPLQNCMTHFVVTFATRTIRAGEEIFVDYDWH